MIETIHWHSLHPRYLGASSVVLDLGANYGHFSKAITERFGCRCVAVEPSPVPYAAISKGTRITKLRAAVGNKTCTQSFHVASESVASSLLYKHQSHIDTIDVKVFSLHDLLAHLALSRVDLLKVDIEGAEIGMLAACTDELIQSISQITIEFHDFCGIIPTEDVKQTIARLHRLGFFSVRMSRIGHQDTWLINQRLLEISRVELLFIRYAVRNWRGFRRVARRITKGALSKSSGG
jgi:FkbM family methyltransferase